MINTSDRNDLYQETRKKVDQASLTKTVNSIFQHIGKTPA